MVSPDFNELMNLIADFISLPILAVVFFNKNLPKYRIFLVALLLIFLSHVFTIVEGYVWPEFFNFIEHIFITFSGALFVFGIVRYFIKGKIQ